MASLSWFPHCAFYPTGWCRTRKKSWHSLQLPESVLLRDPCLILTPHPKAVSLAIGAQNEGFDGGEQSRTAIGALCAPTPALCEEHANEMQNTMQTRLCNLEANHSNETRSELATDSEVLPHGLCYGQVSLSHHRHMISNGAP